MGCGLQVALDHTLGMQASLYEHNNAQLAFPIAHRKPESEYLE